jgi:hypothetical protein
LRNDRFGHGCRRFLDAHRRALGRALHRAADGLERYDRLGRRLRGDRPRGARFARRRYGGRLGDGGPAGGLRSGFAGGTTEKDAANEVRDRVVDDAKLILRFEAETLEEPDQVF